MLICPITCIYNALFSPHRWLKPVLNKCLIALTLSVLFGFNSYASNSDKLSLKPQKSVYQSKDRLGNPVFSDKPPQIQTYKHYIPEKLVVTHQVISQWQQTSSNNNLTKQQHKKRQYNESEKLKQLALKQKQCQKSLKRISYLEGELNKAQKIRVFDQYKQQLTRLRWFQRKNCQ